MIKRARMSWLGGLLMATMLAQPASAEELQKLSIVIFGPPSLGAFLPPVIKAQKLDEKNGVDLDSRSERRMPTPRNSIRESSRLVAARRF